MMAALLHGLAACARFTTPLAAEATRPLVVSLPSAANIRSQSHPFRVPEEQHQRVVGYAPCRAQSTSIEGREHEVPAKAYGMSPQLYQYVFDHTREHPVLRMLRKETLRISPTGASMQITPEQGQFLAWLVEALGVTSAIEVGVFTGYSSIAVALALPDDGKLIACERDPRCMDVAQRYWREAGVAHKVKPKLGLAQDTLQHMLDEGGAGSYDFAFLDAEKRSYDAYYELLLQLLRPGGVVAVDNVLWYGKVADEQVNDKKTQALRAFNDKLLHDERISLTTIGVGDGVSLCRRRH